MIPNHTGTFEIKAFAKLLPDGSIIAECEISNEAGVIAQQCEMIAIEASLFGTAEDACKVALMRAVQAWNKNSPDATRQPTA